jgi:hypothetical protein
MPEKNKAQPQKVVSEKPKEIKIVPNINMVQVRNNSHIGDVSRVIKSVKKSGQ